MSLDFALVSLSVVELSSVMCGPNEKLNTGGREQYVSMDFAL